MSAWVIVERDDLTESVATNTAVIDDMVLKGAVDHAGRNSTRYDVRLYDFVIQIGLTGGATSVTVETMGPMGTWTTYQTGLVDDDMVAITLPARQIRLTWTGGTPDGTGTAGFWAGPRYNGLL